MPFRLRFEPEVHDDIQEAIDWYNTKSAGLGRKFLNELSDHFNKLRKNPFFQVRYDDTHCMPLKKFPFMILYSIKEAKGEVIIHAIFNTSRNPEIWQERKRK